MHNYGFLWHKRKTEQDNNSVHLHQMFWLICTALVIEVKNGTNYKQQLCVLYKHLKEDNFIELIVTLNCYSEVIDDLLLLL